MHQAADESSKRAQSIYVNLMHCNQWFFVIAAAMSIYNYQSTDHKLWFNIISGVLLLSSLILTLLSRFCKFEDYWYQGRALAELTKALTWKYITCSENFESSTAASVVERDFVRTLSQLHAQFPDLDNFTKPHLAILPAITTNMKEIRHERWKNKLDYYIQHRIVEHKQWYSRKAEANRKKRHRLSMIIIISQFIALVWSVVLIKFPDCNWNLVGLLTTIYSAMHASLELKHQPSLKQAYTAASVELSQIEALKSSVTDSAGLSGYVLKSENVISKEHTAWIAQRRK